MLTVRLIAHPRAASVPEFLREPNNRGYEHFTPADTGDADKELLLKGAQGASPKGCARLLYTKLSGVIYRGAASSSNTTATSSPGYHSSLVSFGTVMNALTMLGDIRWEPRILCARSKTPIAIQS